MVNKNNEYNADSIKKLDDIESIRIKSGMYIGDVGPNGLHHLIWEVLNNSADEALNGKCNSITGVLHPDNYFEIIDNGSGIPVGYNHEHKMNALDLIMLFRHSGGKLYASGGSYKKSIGTYGLGLFILNCLSVHTIITVKRDKKIYRAEYSVGKVKVPLKEIGTTKAGDTGTSIKWKFDPTIFVGEDCVYDYDKIASRFKLTSYMVPKIKLVLIQYDNKGKQKSEEFYSELGLRDLLDDILSSRNKIMKNNFHINEIVPFKATRANNRGEREDYESQMEIETCFNIDPVNREETIKAYVNGNEVPLGGSMVNGFKNGYIKAINTFARERGLLKAKDPEFKYSDIRDGLVAVIHIGHPDPTFDSQTKVRLNNPEVSSATNQLVSEKLIRYGIDYPKEMEKLVDYYLRLRKGKDVASKAIDQELKKLTAPTKSSIILSQFVTDCSSNNRSDCELVIVEGKSALSGCKDARNSFDQAILPLKGKLINTYKGALSKVLKNNEVQAIIKVLGTGSTQASNFDMSKARYGRILIAADADPDGSHIALLVLTMINEFLKPWIEEGKVFLTLLPLYVVTTNKGEHYYFYTENEFRRERVKLDNKGIKYQTSRLKGLGEMDAEDLHTFAFNKATRKLIRVSLEDAMYAQDMLDKIMGDDTSYRKDILTEHSIYDVLKED